MGLFDELECEYSLPHPECQERDFQAKSFDCLLARYLITRDGRLLRFRGRGSFGEPEEGGDHDAARPEPERVNFHGDVRFYNSFTMDETRRRFVEYEARFTNGMLEWVRTVEDRIHDTTPVVREPVPDPTLERLPAVTRSRIAGLECHFIEGDERGRPS